MNKTRNIYRWLVGLNVLAILDTAYLTYLHYKPSASSVCNFGEQFNCDIVNKSTYAELFGVPVALLGLATYVLLLIFSLRGLKKDQSTFIPWVFAFVGGGVLFTLYLTGVEAFILRAWCLFCLIQQILILIQFGLFGRLWKLTK